MSTIGTSTSAPRPATAGRVQHKPADGPQIKDEVHLEVTASELHTLTFQQKLADFSSRGIPVQVKLVQAGNAPAPVVSPAPVVPPASADPVPPSSRSLGPSGTVVGMATAVAAAGVAAFGAVVLGDLLSTGTIAAPLVAAEQGLLPLFASLSLPSLVGAAVAGAAAALGGFKAGAKVGELLGKMMDLLAGSAPKIVPKGKPKPAPAPAQPLPKPGKKHRLEPLSRLVSHLVGGFSLMTGAAGGFTSGMLLASGGAAGFQAVTAGAMGASLAMAGVVGAMSAWGGVRLGKSLIEGADRQ